MILDLARLLLFPALMAFAAASDLLTMTISNRVSLALVAGFPVAGGSLRHGAARHPHASRRRRHRAGGRIRLLRHGLGRRRRRQDGGRGALWFGFGHLMNYLLYASLFGGALTLLLLQFRQWPLPYVAHRPALAVAAACQGDRHPLWHRARDRGVDDLSGNRMDQRRSTLPISRCAELRNTSQVTLR